MHYVRPRIIPCLLLKNEGLVKTIKFTDSIYVGDPVNAVKIFNEKGADELIILDIMAGKERKKPNFKLIEDVASECFMPLCYGGGVTNLDDASQIFNLGIEKVSLNTAAIENPKLIKQIADKYGSQSTVVSIDVKKNIFGKYHVFTHGGKQNTKRDPLEVAQNAVAMGAGEIIINSIDQDGMMRGYELDIIKSVSQIVSVPVLAAGGAKNAQDFVRVLVEGGASGAVAGSCFVFHGKHKAVLITYPSFEQLKDLS